MATPVKRVPSCDCWVLGINTKEESLLSIGESKAVMKSTYQYHFVGLRTEDQPTAVTLKKTLPACSS
jgi:hypothetical protein